jgi:type 1 fimbriae regulatory protein FimB/type 1 fimbriae regulatory protein FimE
LTEKSCLRLTGKSKAYRHAGLERLTVMDRASFSAKLPPAKPKNVDRRAREYLTPSEVDQLIHTARKVGRYGHRDATLILMMYRHALRVSEVSGLRWDVIDLKMALFHVRRLKNGMHPLHGPELRALRRLKMEYPGLRIHFGARQSADRTRYPSHYPSGG